MHYRKENISFHPKCLSADGLIEIPFYKILLLLYQIKEMRVKNEIQDALLLALIAILVESVGNIKFGPELYVAGNNSNADVFGLFETRIKKMAQELEKINTNFPKRTATVIEGDARDCAILLKNNGINQIDIVITSPPYPAEKDYTRQTRLELIFLGYVYDRVSLQTVKKAMIRSNTKGIYKSDKDSELIQTIPEISAITDELKKKIEGKTDGFSQLYPKVTEEYFGAQRMDTRVGSALVDKFKNEECRIEIRENVRGAEVFAAKSALQGDQRQQRQRLAHGAAGHDRRAESSLGASHHRGRSVRRLRQAG